MSDLKFLSSKSLAKFKADNGIKSVEVIKNPVTGKTFFVCPEDSSISGKVATTIDFTKALTVSWCTDEATSFNMLHNTPDQTANVQATL